MRKLVPMRDERWLTAQSVVRALLAVGSKSGTDSSAAGPERGLRSLRAPQLKPSRTCAEVGVGQGTPAEAKSLGD